MEYITLSASGPFQGSWLIDYRLSGEEWRKNREFQVLVAEFSEFDSLTPYCNIATRMYLSSVHQVLSPHPHYSQPPPRITAKNGPATVSCSNKVLSPIACFFQSALVVRAGPVQASFGLQSIARIVVKRLRKSYHDGDITPLRPLRRQNRAQSILDRSLVSN